MKYGVLTINEMRNERGPAAGAVGRRALAAGAMAPVPVPHEATKEPRHDARGVR